MADISSIKLPSGNTYDVKDILGRQSIPYGIVTSDSTTVFTATVDGVTQLSNGVCCLIRNNNKQTSASGWTLNVNDLGAKPVYNNMADASRETTIYNKAYTMLFVYDEDRVDGGCWICYRGYDANTNTIGYQLRTNSTVMNVSDTARYYKLYFMSADNTMWVPASVNSTNNATAARAVNQRPINPFGRIVYTSANTNYTAGSNLAATTIWDQYTLSLGYSFNRTGAALTMTVEAPVYVKCAPQADGSAIMDADTPIVQALPSTADGKIYIYLGVAYSAVNIELVPHHPVYYHDGTAIRLWTGANSSASVDWDDVTNKPTFATVATSGSYNDLSNKPTIPSAVTESTVAGWGFTKNTGTYSKPSGGIPKTDLASAVQTSLGKADTALQSYTETDPTVPSWAKASSKPTYTASEVGALPDTTAIPTNTSDLTNDSGFITGMTILSYGNSTWADFEAAYNANKVVYCRASSNANPASGSQTRLAFMAYVNNATTPTNVEFQYYRSVSTHTASQQGDQVFVYKLDKTSGWSVITREASVKVVAGDGLGGTYSNGTMTLTGPTKVSDLTNDSGFITSESDPVFTASVAHGITSTDISNWNGKSDFSGSYNDLTNKPTIPADLWEQGVDANDQPVPGAIKAKDYVDSEDVTKTNSATSLGAFVAGGGNTATGSYAVIAGCDNTANGSSTVFGYNNTAAGGGGSTLLGNSNQATSGTWGFAAGVGNTISHNNVTALGWYNTASNYNAVAMGRDNIASGNSSSAIGYGNTASETAAHAEGRNTTASGKAAHSEGYATEASGCQSHAEGQGTQATARYNHVFGTYNISDPGFTAATEKGTYIEIVGNGDDAQNRSNARTLDWSGNEWVAGLVSVGSSSTPPTPTANNHLTTKKYVDDIVGNIETLLASI